MLYMTVGDKTTTHTPQRVLKDGSGAMFVPMQLPAYTQQELEAMKDQSFGQNIAQVLNLFFGTELTGWDVELCIGRYPMKLASLGGKIYVAELWHNLENAFTLFLQRLVTLLGGNYSPECWGSLAVRIATLFGLRGEAMKQGADTLHIACSEKDLQTAIAAWYARQMGLPIGRILFGCTEGSPLWSLLSRGQYSAGAPVCAGLEHFLYGVLGEAELERFRRCRETGKNYLMEGDMSQRVKDVFFAAAIGTDRLPKVINSLYRTDSYLFDEDVAFGYSALQDYRARCGDHQPAMLFALECPANSCELIGEATGLRPEDIKKKVIMV